MSRALGIAVVCFPTLGGSGIVATELAAELARRGHRVHVLSSAPPSRPLPEHPQLSFHEVTAPSYPVLPDAPYTLALASAIVELAREECIELLHVHYAVPHAASALLARRTLGPDAPRLVTTLHGTDVTRLGGDPSYHAVTRFCVEDSDAITVPSVYLGQQAHDVLGVRAQRAIEVIPNFVDTAAFAAPAARERAHFEGLLGAHATEPRSVHEDPSGPVLFHVSNFRAVKRVTDLFEVLARVRKTLPARLVVVGDGPERAVAAQRARALGVAPFVSFLGKRSEFAEHLGHADAFVLTSETESFGLAALEALSCGVPVVGYRVGGLPEVVTPEVGRLVEPFDLDAFARAVVEVVSAPGARARLGEAARRRVLDHYRREAVVDRYEALFRSLVADGADRVAEPT